MVEIRRKIAEGWRNKENKRIGACVVLDFYDEKTGKRLFSWAPLLEDEEFIIKTFNFIRDIDGIHKAEYNLCQQIDGEFRRSESYCERFKND
jgi:hypothetical protein